MSVCPICGWPLCQEHVRAFDPSMAGPTNGAFSPQYLPYEPWSELLTRVVIHRDDTGPPLYGYKASFRQFRPWLQWQCCFSHAIVFFERDSSSVFSSEPTMPWPRCPRSTSCAGRKAVLQRCHSFLRAVLSAVTGMLKVVRLRRARQQLNSLRSCLVLNRFPAVGTEVWHGFNLFRPELVRPDLMQRQPARQPPTGCPSW